MTGRQPIAAGVGMTYQLEVLTEWSQIEAVRAEWEGLRRVFGNSDLQLHPDWLAIDQRCVDGEAKSPAVVCVRQNGNLVGIAPYQVRKYRWECRLGYAKVAEFPVSRADLCGMSLLAAEQPDVQEALLCTIADAGVPLHLVYLECVADRSVLWRLLHESPEIRRRYWVYRPRPVSNHYRIRLPATMPEYLSKFSSESRKKLRKAARRLEEACGGRLEVRRIRSEEQLPEFMAQVERVSARSWKGTRLQRVLRATPARLEGWREYARRSWLRSYVLIGAGQPIAFRTAYQFGGVLSLDETAYDPEWREYQPGNVLLLGMLEDLFQVDKPDIIDFGYGENDNKRFFSNDCEHDANFFLVRKEAYGALALSTYAGCIAAGATMRRILDGAGLRSRIRGWLRGSAGRRSQQGSRSLAPGQVPLL